MKTWESRARSSRMALAPKPSACRLRMSVAMSEPLMDARERRAKGRAAKVFARFFSRATVGFLGRRDLTEIAVQSLGQARRFGLGARNEDPSGDLVFDTSRPGLRLGFGVECPDLCGVPATPDMGLPNTATARALAWNE